MYVIIFCVIRLIQKYRHFYVATKFTNFDAILNLKMKIELMQKKYKLALKNPKLYQQLYIINIVVLLLVVGIAVYYFLDWDLLIYALLDTLTV